MCSYPYQHLDQTTFEIRLLTLKPGAWEHGIQCSLRHARLNSRPWYEALSYVWGDPTNTRPIVVDECNAVKVTANLEIALRHLRREDAPRVLWVDALCINQDDPQERSAQVQRMRDIYRSAKRVLAWTGEASEDSDEAMDLMMELGHLISHAIQSKSESFKSGPEDMRKLGFDPATKNWSSLWNLWNRPYWNRVWIIQELASCYRFPTDIDSFDDLENDRGLVGCGLRWMPLALYACSALYINIDLNLNKDAYIEFDNEKVIFLEPLSSLLHHTRIQNVHALLMSAALQTAASGDGYLCALMRVTKSFKASDVRDKVYSLLGISQEDIFTVDYTKSAGEVFKDLVALHLHNPDKTSTMSQLEILYGNRHRRDQFGPSWVPESEGLEGMTPMWTIDYSRHFRAGGNLNPAPIKIDKENGFVNIGGVVVGIVDKVIGPGRILHLREDLPQTYSYKDTLDDPDIQYQGKLMAKIAEFGNTLPESLWNKFWRTLLGDQDCQDKDEIIRPAPAHLGRQAETALRFADIPDEYMPEAPTIQRFMQYTLSFMSQMNGNLIQRNFFTTQCGQMGLGPYTIRVGDIVTVLFGGKYCFVLRPAGEKFELIGDAYVQGIMGGELLEAYEAGNIESRIFSLS